MDPSNWTIYSTSSLSVYVLAREASSILPVVRARDQVKERALLANTKCINTRSSRCFSK